MPEEETPGAHYSVGNVGSGAVVQQGEHLYHVTVQLQDAQGAQTLMRFGYDTTEAPPSSCPQPANTQGRLRFHEDSFGRTWYQYDEAGSHPEDPI